MLSFENDYSEGAHPKLLQALVDTNFVQQVGYGEDDFSSAAKDKIRAACQAPDADVFFLVGGTQTNAVVIDSVLHATEGVVSAVTGHVNQHEAGAIEFTGHKVIPLPAHAGKIDAGELRALMENFCFDDWGVKLAAAFDIKPALIGTEYKGVRIYGMEELESYLKNNQVNIAVLTVPKAAAIPVTERLTAGGIDAIWNFTNVELTEPNSSTIVENVHFSDSLLSLSYFVAERCDEKAAGEEQ